MSAPRRPEQGYVGEADSDSAGLGAKLESLQRDAELDAVLGPLAHDLKNALTPIRGYAELLLTRLDAIAPADRALFERALRTIDRESAQLEARLRALGRPSSDEG